MDGRKAGPPDGVICVSCCCGQVECKLFRRSLSAEEAGSFFDRDGRTISRLRAKGAVRCFKLADGSYRYYLPHLIEDLTVRETPEADELGAEQSDSPGPEEPKGSDPGDSKASLDKIKKDLKDL